MGHLFVRREKRKKGEKGVCDEWRKESRGVLRGGECEKRREGNGRRVRACDGTRDETGVDERMCDVWSVESESSVE